MDTEDVSQEIWFRLMDQEPDVAPDEIGERALYHAELLARVGRQRRRTMPIDSYSNLSLAERREFDNLAYASGNDDD